MAICEVGEPYIKLLPGGSWVEGVVLVKFLALDGKRMFVMQHPETLIVYMGEEGPLTKRKPAIPLVHSLK